MRIDLTLRDGGDPTTDRDIAVVSRGPVRWSEVVAQFPDLRAYRWAGGAAVEDDCVVGGPGLRSGSVLSTGIAAPATVTALRLEVVGGPSSGTAVRLGTAPVVIGRDPACDLVLADPLVSRRHASWTSRAGALELRDLDSTNGTLVDGAPLRGHRRLAAGSVVRIGNTVLAVRDGRAAVAGTRAGPEGTVLVHPVARPAAPEPVVIRRPTPPSTASRTGSSGVLISVVIGLVGGLGAALVLHAPALAVLAVLAPLGTGCAAGWQRRCERRTRAADEASYATALAAADDHAAAAVADEATARRARDPDPAVVLSTALAPGARLWERRHDDPALLELRVGLGTVASSTLVEDGTERRAAGTLPDVPTLTDLGARPVALVGPPALVDPLARWLVLQLAVAAGPDTVQIEVHTDDPARWQWARWLPHLHTPGGSPGSTAARVVRVVDSRTGDALLPIGGEATMIVCHSPDEVPPGYRTVQASAEHVGEVAVDGVRAVADGLDAVTAEVAARALAPLRPAVADRATGALPDECRWIDLAAALPSQPAELRRRWSAVRGIAGARTVIGMGTDGPVTLDLDGHGPHLLVAGTTGSGKSELVQTLVAGLASACPPWALTFLLVDFKGGSALARCAALPHCVGTVTDLDAALARRVLASLDSELRRREIAFAAAGAADLAAYAEGVNGPAQSLPRLVVVVDEFAVLAEQLPDFVPQLIGLARRGRSLGLHLVLATQRPAGAVSEEIRANVETRIVLRTADPQDSVDVVGVPEAAQLPRSRPGRALLRHDGHLTRLQVARVTTRRRPNDAAHRDLEVITLGPWRSLPAETTDAAGPAGAATDLDQVVAVTTAAARAAGLPAPRRPWLPPLPARLRAADLPDAPDEAAPAVGLVDLPREQAQRPLRLPSTDGGCWLLVGRARSGRTGAALAVVLAACAAAPPDRLHVQAVGRPEELAAALGALPHVGSIVDCSDTATLARLVGRLAVDSTDDRAADPGASGPADRRPRLLLVVDGWDELAIASARADGGRTCDELAEVVRRRCAVGDLVVVTGARPSWPAALAASATERFVLPLADPADYLAAGVARTDIPTRPPAGRAVRVADGSHVQFVLAEPDASRVASARRDVGASRPVTVRALPARVSVPVTRRRNREGGPEWLVARIGDDADELWLRPVAQRVQLLVAGPPRSGVSTALAGLLTQSSAHEVMVLAAPASPLPRIATRLGVPVLGSTAPPAPSARAGCLLMVDDADQLDETAAGAVAQWVADGRPAVVGVRTAALTAAYGGLAAQLRRWRHGALLQPSPNDTGVLGLTVTRTPGPSVPGRGLLFGDADWHPALRDGPVAAQLVAAPLRVDGAA